MSTSSFAELATGVTVPQTRRGFLSNICACIT